MPIRGAALFLLVLAAPALAEQTPWQQHRDEFLGQSWPLLEAHCNRGREANADGLSAFNDGWVRRAAELRFKAGVAPVQGSGPFFAGLSAAMRRACPQVW